jgi:type I restriction-modification system DNA methylase subunit
VALFSSKIIRDALHGYERKTTAEESAAAAGWAVRAADPGLVLQNESQLEQEFNHLIVQTVLGYRAPAPGEPGTMRVKQPIPGGTIVDLALGEFDGDRALIVAPFELKGPKIALDRIMPGRNKTPVQQAWNYAMDAPGARWVLLSDMREVRLYAFGHGRQDYEAFDLRKLNEAAELRRFQLLLRPEGLLFGPTRDLLDRSAAADRDITDALYRDYRSLRDELLTFVASQASGLEALKRIELVQRLLDRLLFIAFAEDSFLLPENSLRGAISFHNPYDPQPKWNQIKKLFEWVDKGGPQITAYNGGLFRAEPALDALLIPDHLVERFTLLSGYDFRSEVSVTILGHIFEQSITDIEELRAETRGDVVPKAGKRKREGVVYTPDFITRFIVEQTIGKHLEEIATALLPDFGKSQPSGEVKWRKGGEGEYWAAYLKRLGSLRVVDPACGSGAFLVAAFDHLHAEQEKVRGRLMELGANLLASDGIAADATIITGNLFGVDVNAESVELTKLALWLKTAKRNRPLESLDGNIRHGNSLVADSTVDANPFDWPAAFPAILDGGPDQGFDIVLGNPPYVRMEFLKAIKPYLEKRYRVASDRADLYAYFFELGIDILKAGGRMGYISSSTFFRTGSGAPLRDFLSTGAVIEAVVDFGDLQVFEGVTTYPAIVTLRKDRSGGDGGPVAGDLTYLIVRTMPEDLTKTFETEARPMPRARLGKGTWRFENDTLDAIRAKMAHGRRTLAETFGPPLYGIKTGLNDAFVLTNAERNALIARDPRSAELLKPFLVGENLKRWHVEGDDLWLIYTPKNRVEIDDYPAIRDHLAPWRSRLEARATKQAWWELQQAQANYAAHFEQPKLIWPHFQNRPQFTVERSARYLNNKCFFWPGVRPEICALLNSKLLWFALSSVARGKRGGYIEAEAQYVGSLPTPEVDAMTELTRPAEVAAQAAEALHSLRLSTRRRLGDLSGIVVTSAAFLDWPHLSFVELQALLRKRCKVTIPVAERDEWEHWFNARRADASALELRIADAEAEIDARVYRLFDLTTTEVAAVEDSLVLASPALSLKAYEAVSAVEGLILSDAGRERVTRATSAADRRTDVARAHAA